MTYEEKIKREREEGKHWEFAIASAIPFGFCIGALHLGIPAWSRGLICISWGFFAAYVLYPLIRRLGEAIYWWRFDRAAKRAGLTWVEDGRKPKG